MYLSTPEDTHFENDAAKTIKKSALKLLKKKH